MKKQLTVYRFPYYAESNEFIAALSSVVHVYRNSK